jgi:hypothetical protein
MGLKGRALCRAGSEGGVSVRSGGRSSVSGGQGGMQCLWAGLWCEVALVMPRRMFVQTAGVFGFEAVKR